MSIEKKIRESFSEITPLTDNETVIRNVLERTETMDKKTKAPRSKRVLVTVIAAAAALAAVTVSVGAATGWDLNSAFGRAALTVADNHGAHEIGVYSTEEAQQEMSSQPERESSQADIAENGFDYLSGGKELDLWYSFDDFKLNIKGICADDYIAYVLYDIVFDEDFDCSPRIGWTAWDTCTIVDAVDKSLDEQPSLGMVCTFGNDIISREGNVLHCCVRPKLSEEYTWVGKTLTLDFKSVRRYIPTSEEDDLGYSDKQELLFGENGTQIEIPIDFPIFETQTWEINGEVDLAADEYNRDCYGDNLPGTVKYFSTTPLSSRIYIEADTSSFVKGDSYTLDVSVEAGGETLPIVSGEGFCWTDENGQGESMQYAQPIDPAAITSITVCGQTFTLE